jgi:hypothetical protein
MSVTAFPLLGTGKVDLVKCRLSQWRKIDNRGSGWSRAFGKRIYNYTNVVRNISLEAPL